MSDEIRCTQTVSHDRLRGVVSVTHIGIGGDVPKSLRLMRQ